jgi:two-component system LytT family response regulator
MHDRLETLKENLKHEEIQKIALPVSDGLIFVNVHDITLVEADRAYSHVWMKDGSNLLVSRRLKFFEDLLADRNQFLRVHRSSIININYVKKYARSEGFIFLDNNKSVRVARDKKVEFEDFIKEIRL